MLRYHRKHAANPSQEWTAAKMITKSTLKTITTKKSKNPLVMTTAVQLAWRVTLL